MASFDFTNGLPPGATLTRAGPGSVVAANGLLSTAAADVARIDYDPILLTPRGILIEPASTNLQLNSDQCDTAFAGAAAVVANDRIAPNGVMAADKFTLNAGQILNRANPVTAGATASFSVYAFVDGTGAGTWRMNGFGNASGDLNIDVVLPANQFTRLTMTKTYAAGDTDRRFRIFRGAGIAAGEIWLFGLQIELAAQPTSYIATGATAANRAADVLSLNWASQGQADGTVNARYLYDDNSVEYRATTISGGVSTVPTNLTRSRIRNISYTEAITPPGRIVRATETGTRSS